MTRFSLSIDEAVQNVDWACNNSIGGEIIVPKIPSYRLTDLAEAINKNNKLKIVGLRKGEKIHEEMITSADSLSTYESGKYYFILTDNKSETVNKFKKKFKNLKKVKNEFVYNSGQNNTFLTVPELKKMIQKEFFSN